MSEMLEAACDNVAFAIDDLDGNLVSTQINKLVDEALSTLEHSREEFDEMFTNIYLCDVFQYAVNAEDDAKWAVEDSDVEVKPVEDLDELMAMVNSIEGDDPWI